MRDERGGVGEERGKMREVDKKGEMRGERREKREERKDET